jgi:hypothetical protein
MKNKLISIFLVIILGLIIIPLQSCSKKGCTQSCADNYDPKASKDDGSCFRTKPPSVAVGTACTTGTFVTYEISEATYNQLEANYFSPGSAPCPYATITTLTGETVTGYLRALYGGGTTIKGQVGC